MRLPCGCVVNHVYGRVLLSCLRTKRIRLFDFLHGSVNRKQTRYSCGRVK